MSSTPSELATVLHAVVDAWEALPAGRPGRAVLEDWMLEKLKPAVDKAYRVLGRRAPK